MNKRVHVGMAASMRTTADDVRTMVKIFAGWMSDLGGTTSAISIAVIPSDQMSACACAEAGVRARVIAAAYREVVADLLHDLGRHPVRSPRERAATSELVVELCGRPKVRQFDLPVVVEQDVASLDIAVNDLDRLEVVESLCLHRLWD